MIYAGQRASRQSPIPRRTRDADIVATVFKRGGKGNRGGRYYVAYLDHTGKRIVRSARTTDKATAERIAAKYESEAALRREGVIDPTLDGISRESQRTIESHQVDFEAKLTVAGSCSRHVQRTRLIIRRFREFCNLERPVDITADHCNRFAESLRADGLSATTIHAYLTALRSFTRGSIRMLGGRSQLPPAKYQSVEKCTASEGRVQGEESVQLR